MRFLDDHIVYRRKRNSSFLIFLKLTFVPINPHMNELNPTKAMYEYPIAKTN